LVVFQRIKVQICHDVSGTALFNDGKFNNSQIDPAYYVNSSAGPLSKFKPFKQSYHSGVFPPGEGEYSAASQQDDDPGGRMVPS
jgi:hypothetical protein